ncbi:MAG: hypothetical protein ACHQ9S_11820 [Candidatus Binatia bacterium]
MPSKASKPFDLLRIFDALAGVNYIVVGGVAATLHGAPRLTFDLDIVPDPSPANIERLAAALQRLEAYVREPGDRHIPASRQLLMESAHAAAPGQLRLRTQYGPVDILWRLHEGRGYRELESDSVVLSDTERQIRVLGIETLIAVKEAAGRPRDRQDSEYLQLILRRSKERAR